VIEETKNNYPLPPKGGAGWTFFSYILHPLLMPTACSFIILWNDIKLTLPEGLITPWIAVLGAIFFSTFLVPAGLSVLLASTQRISSIKNPTMQDKRLLIVYTQICYIMIYYFFHKNPFFANSSLTHFFLGINIALLLALILSVFTTLSLHAIGVGGLVGTVIGLVHYSRMGLYNWVAVALIISVVACYSRYKLKAHEPMDIYIGYTVGILCQSLVFFWGIG
jgi:hypothetical protein